MLNDIAKIFIFGSYISSNDYNDIDILLVVKSSGYFEEIRAVLDQLDDCYPGNLIHIHVYTENEYINTENKFSLPKVNYQISYDEFLELYKL